MPFFYKSMRCRVRLLALGCCAWREFLLRQRGSLLRLAVLAAALASCDEGATDGGPGANFGVGCTSARAGAAQSEIGCGLLQSSGIPAVDAAIAQDIPTLRQFFGVLPAFSYFDECGPQYKNALAMPQGYILFGRHMAQEFSSGGSTLPVIAILAHEFGHMHQFANGWRQGSTVRNFELEADAFAGFYGALQKAWSGADLNSYYQALFRAGDFNFNDPNHHGTPVQRLGAGGLGLLAAIIALQQGFNPTPAQLHAFFQDRILNCIVQVQDPSVCLNPSVSEQSHDSVVRALIASLDNNLAYGIATGARSLTEIRSPRALGFDDSNSRWYRRR